MAEGSLPFVWPPQLHAPRYRLLDYSADTVTSLEGQSGTVNGITKGYADGTLTFYADMWNGSSNDGEFWITGDAFPPSEATKYYDFGGQQVAMRQDGTLTYLHGDHGHLRWLGQREFEHQHHG